MPEPMQALILESLWRNALAAVPVAFAVAILCRCCVKRPATRHALWTGVIVLLLMPPILPELGEALRAERSEEQASQQAEQEQGEDLVSEQAEPADAEPPAPETKPAQAAPRSEPRVFTRSAPNRTARERTSAPSRLESPPVERPRAAPTRSSVNDHEAAVRTRSVEPAPSERPGRSEPRAVEEATPDPPPPSEAAIDQGLQHSPEDASAPPIAPDRAPPPVRAVATPEGPPALAGLRALQVAIVTLQPHIDALTSAAAQLRDQTVIALTSPAYGEALLALRDAVVGLPPIPPAIWMLGVAIALSVCMIRVASGRRLLASAAPAPPAVREMVEDASERLGLRRAPEAYMIAERVSPMIWCGRRPRLILPIRLWRELDEIGRAAVIHHELAHLKRRDHWVRWIELGAALVYWWHPVLWWARRRIHEEADLCCDAWVAHLLPSERRRYAQALLQTQTFLSSADRPPIAALAAASPGKRRFARRITMLMTSRLKPGASLAGLALAATLVLGGSFSTPLWACPPKEEHRAKADARKELQRALAQERQRRADCEDESPEAQEEEELSTFERFLEGRGESDSEEECDGSLDRRIQHLERRLQSTQQRLQQILLRRGLTAPSMGKHPGGNALFTPKPPKTPHPLQAPRALQGQLRSGPGFAHFLRIGDDKEFERSYALPEDRLEALTKLMARDDVPVLIRPGDEKITVIGTAEQHRVFADFVALLRDREETREPYRFSNDGKRKDMYDLMALPTVPTLISTRDDAIVVHGDPITQRSFKAFVDMIDPDRPAGQGEARAHAEPQSEEAAAIQREARRVELKARALLEQATRLYAMHEALLAQVEALERQADSLRDQADSQRDKAESLRDRAEDMRERAEETDDESERIRLELEADALEMEADHIESAADLIESQADVVEEQAHIFDERADELEERAEELEERAEELEESLDERVSEIEAELDERAEIMESIIEEQADELQHSLRRLAEGVAEAVAVHD